MALSTVQWFGLICYYFSVPALYSQSVNRRTYLEATATAGVVSLAGCSDSNDDSDGNSGGSSTQTYDGDASEYILPVESISGTLPGEWEQTGSRQPQVEPVGLESFEIRQHSRIDTEGTLDFAFAVFETVDDVATYLGDNRDEIAADDNLEFIEQDVGDEAFSVTTADQTALYVRVANVYIQLIGTPHISNLRTLAETQISQLS